MAMADANTLVVANNGTEAISVVDLNALQEVEQIPMGPIGPIPECDATISAIDRRIIECDLVFDSTVLCGRSGSREWIDVAVEPDYTQRFSAAESGHHGEQRGPGPRRARLAR